MYRGARRAKVLVVNPAHPASRPYAVAPRPAERSDPDTAARPVSRVLPVLMVVAALLVFAGVYIAGTALHVGILHSVALLGAAGTLLTMFMAAALGDR